MTIKFLHFLITKYTYSMKLFPHNSPPHFCPKSLKTLAFKPTLNKELDKL